MGKDLDRIAQASLEYEQEEKKVIIQTYKFIIKELVRLARFGKDIETSVYLENNSTADKLQELFESEGFQCHQCFLRKINQTELVVELMPEKLNEAKQQLLLKRR